MDDFDEFVVDAEPRLRRALVAARGPTAGRDAVAEALAYAWEHWTKVRSMENPIGYLYRVGQSRTRPRRVPRLTANRDHDDDPQVEPGLSAALGRLSEQQRVAVFLVHGCGWTHSEVGDLLDVSPSTVSTHVQRGLARLRDELEVGSHA